MKVLQISDEYVPYLESGNFDVNSCVDDVVIADWWTWKNICVRNTFQKVGDYMIDVCSSCLLSWLVYVHVDVSLVKIICLDIGQLQVYLV